jgi:hypothetical protein
MAPILFIVVKEYEPINPDAFSDQALVDNTIHILYRDFGDGCYQYDVFVRRRDGKRYVTVPYGVTVYTEKELIEFIRFICHTDARILIDVYHGETAPQGSEEVKWLNQFETDSRLVIGYHKQLVGKGSFRILKRALKQLHTVFPNVV